MPLLIDAYNVLHTAGVLPPEIAGIDVEGLIDLIYTSRYGRQHATLVCDGTPPVEAPIDPVGGVRALYAGPGVSADDVIGRLVAQSSAPRRLTVVSSDRAVLRVARRRRCRTLTSESFLRHLADDHEARGGAAPRRNASAALTRKLPGVPPAALPRGIVDEAEELAAAGPEAMALPEPLNPLAEAGPQDMPAPSPTPPGPEPAATAPPPPDQPPSAQSVLPDSLVTEAEALAAADAETTPAPSAEPPETTPAPDDAPDPADDEPALPTDASDLLTPDILEEAMRLWRAGRDETE